MVNGERSSKHSFYWIGIVEYVGCLCDMATFRIPG